MGHTYINSTNVSNHVSLEHETLDALTQATYGVDLGATGVLVALCALLAVFFYTKNFAGVIGVGLFFIAYSFVVPSLTGVGAIDFIFIVLMGLSILFTGIFSHNKNRKGEAQ